MFILNSDLVVSEGLFALFLLEKEDPWWRRRCSFISICGTVRRSIAGIRTSETSIIRCQTISHELSKAGTTGIARGTRNVSVPFIFVLVEVTRPHYVGSRGVGAMDLSCVRQRSFSRSTVAFHDRQFNCAETKHCVPTKTC